MTTKLLEKFDKSFDKKFGLVRIFPKQKGISKLPRVVATPDIKSFFHLYLEKILEDVMKCVPEEGIKWMQEGHNKDKKGFTDGFNSAIEQTLKNLEDLLR